MRAFNFRHDILAQIEHDRFLYPCPQVQRRTELLRLAAHGLLRADLIRLTGRFRATAQHRLGDDRDDSLDAGRRCGYRGQPNGLARHAATLEEHFRHNSPATVADAADAIFHLTKVRHGPTQAWQFLTSTGADSERPPAASYHEGC